MRQTISERRLAANRANARKSTGPRTAAGKQRVSQNACRHRLYSKIHTLEPALAAFNHQRAISISAQYADPALRQLHYQLWIEHGYCELAFSIQDELYAQANAAYPGDPDFTNYAVLCQESFLLALQRFQNLHTRRFDSLVVTIHKFNKDAAKQQKQSQATAAPASPQPQSICPSASTNRAFSKNQTHPHPGVLSVATPLQSLQLTRSRENQRTNPPNPATQPAPAPRPRKRASCAASPTSRTNRQNAQSNPSHPHPFNVIRLTRCRPCQPRHKPPALVRAA